MSPSWRTHAGFGCSSIAAALQPPRDGSACMLEPFCRRTRHTRAEHLACVMCGAVFYWRGLVHSRGSCCWDCCGVHPEIES